MQFEIGLAMAEKGDPQRTLENGEAAGKCAYRSILHGSRTGQVVQSGYVQDAETLAAKNAS